MINVQPGVFFEACRVLGKPIARCKRKAVFSIFGNDGHPAFSRLEGCVCAFHLPYAVRAVKASQK